MKKKLRLKGLEGKNNSTTVIERCIKTTDGFEDAHIDLATGEVTYTPSTCTDVGILKEALGKEGVSVEEVES